ncbi:glycoside hydrolase family 38 C-terminal domain-containing protein [Chitinophaga sp. HK235]|uniref:glycoside hydrolase family 38 C-terminal domain-containing protein n=1 Tax=Chitinophaga sp. HK235 TaxID=2952571 RepID=UPI001BA5F64D|nr:glycoside hydrolase family 38 C-terminal domain-containing protein [Chitinophaga sp. HK235]
MRIFYCITVLLACALSSTAQKTVPYLGKVDWINGYDHETEGENIRYYSAYPDYATTALLTRATDGHKTIAWQTAAVPARIKGPYVYFSWVAGHSTATSSGDRHFDLFVDDEKLLTITTLPRNQAPVWSFVAADSSRIVFEQIRKDGANDAHGLMFLRLPLSRVTPGKPVRLKIIGQAQQSNDWLMTFKFSFQEKVDINPQPFILKNGQQPITLTALHFGTPRTFQVTVGGKKVYSFPVEDGVNKFDIPVNPVRQPDSIRIVVTDAGKILADKFVALKPVTYRELNFIHHSHTDIGYSHLQPEVLKIHLRNINDALDMIATTRNYPEEAKFKWNIESLWAVEHFLQQATPEKKAAFIQAVKDGNICLSALYANILTGLCLPEETFHFTDFAAQLRKTYGLRIPSAMISDVPGYTWTTVTALAKGGVKYFSSGPNYLGESHPYLGDRVGHFVRNWGDKPVWWASPSGEEKILFWAGGKGYSSWHGTAPGAVFESGPQKIAAYLNELDEKKYPYDIVQWRYNVVADNGPIDTSISRFVKQWNEKYASPKIVLNTTDKLFETFEQKYGKDLPVVKGDITPYWEDGAGSTAKEEGQNRLNSLRLSQLANAYAMLAPGQYDVQQFYNAWTNVLMFHEHTWGAHNSISQPDVPFVTEQWRIKKQFMLDADSQINVIADKLFQPLTDERSRSIAVVNTLSWPRSGPVKIRIAGKSVKDAHGRKYPLQRLSDGTYVFLASNVPAFGTEVYTVSDEPATAAASFTRKGNMLTNGNITVVWDPIHGSITQLNAKDGHNYAGTFQSQGLNSYWYVPGQNPADAVTNQPVQVQVLESGPVVTSIALRAQAPGANALEKRLTLYANSSTLLIENTIDKKPVRQKEALHFGFPFDVPSGKVTLDAGYGTLRYLEDQLPGSNMDFLFGRRWMDISNTANGLQWMLLEAPMAEPANMIDERLQIAQSHKEWKKTGQPTALWFSYVMNNYWHTNYKSDQQGSSSYHYALQPHDQVNGTALEMSAADFSQPLIDFPVKKGITLPVGLFRLTNPAVIATAIIPQENGQYLIRLFNPGQTPQNTGFNWGTLKPARIAVVRNGITKDANATFSLPAMGVEEYLITP